ncbi:SigE family RNA polymerase sigma factor [Streptomyces sp. HNM0663]|uniref:RNA polymerase sigma factor n=1 Tax=Streptomyces chengmaiensis TaxID=3040919 RepID=A0ABT6HFJ8_9ACTN|nr:SigE family RNA polymerase sigma factor [Streptomyces chengmaiensis]MDH2387540.1 SigE family RNA polymerase sigma factor [Streptomyces chengmaiensis]
MAQTNGEVLEFEEYVRTRQEALLRSARRLVPDPVDAQDLLQTALARTYGRWDGIADKSLADAYLRRVMINTRTEWWRARKLEEVPTEQLPDASVEDGSEQRADRALLMDVLKVLAPKQRSVVVLRHWEQMSTEETAAALGMSAGTVKSTLHRALARLRQELERRERELDAGVAVRDDVDAVSRVPGQGGGRRRGQGHGQGRDRVLGEQGRERCAA